MMPSGRQDRVPWCRGEVGEAPLYRRAVERLFERFRSPAVFFMALRSVVRTTGAGTRTEGSSSAVSAKKGTDGRSKLRVDAGGVAIFAALLTSLRNRNAI